MDCLCLAGDDGFLDSFSIDCHPMLAFILDGALGSVKNLIKKNFDD